MSKHQLARVIQKELIDLNNRIDRKIIQGRSYGEEAGKHKMLLRQLRQFRKSSKSSLFGFLSFL